MRPVSFVPANLSCCRALRVLYGSKPIWGAAGDCRITKRTPATERIVSSFVRCRCRRPLTFGVIGRAGRKATGSRNYGTNFFRNGTNCFFFCSPNSRGGSGAKSRAINARYSSGRSRPQVLPNELGSLAFPVQERRRKGVFCETKWPRKKPNVKLRNKLPCQVPFPQRPFPTPPLRKGTERSATFVNFAVWRCR